MAAMDIAVSVEYGDVAEFPCDVLVLKYAQALYGADARVADLLDTEVSPRLGNYELLPGQGRVPARNVLFVGVAPLVEFGYGPIREFASYALQVVVHQLPEAEHVAMTMHGVGYGLDERESFLAQLGGLFDALRDFPFPLSLRRITFVERSRGRANRLQEILDEYLPGAAGVRNARTSEAKLSGAGPASHTKPHVFVAMPFADEMEDVYIFGIQGPVNAAGFLCERVDMARFTGDILERIKQRIETADLVIADLTGANPNVYLEVGYAWGRNRPVLLLSRKVEELCFDVKGHRCIVYKSIADLARRLAAELPAFGGEGGDQRRRQV